MADYVVDNVAFTTVHVVDYVYHSMVDYVKHSVVDNVALYVGNLKRHIFTTLCFLCDFGMCVLTTLWHYHSMVRTHVPFSHSKHSVVMTHCVPHPTVCFTMWKHCDCSIRGGGGTPMYNVYAVYCVNMSLETLIWCFLTPSIYVCYVWYFKTVLCNAI